MTVHELSDLEQPVEQLSLPQPVESNYRYGYSSFATTSPVVSMGGMGGSPIAATGIAGTGGLGGSADTDPSIEVDAGADEEADSF